MPRQQMKTLKSILALGAFFVVAVGLSACGGGVPGDAVVNMAGNPISTTAFNHWMYVAAKGSAQQSPGAPVIVPTDPPNFTNCIAQVRKQIPSLAKRTDKELKSDCSQLFTSLSGQVLDFLIRAYWYQATAAKLGIKVTDAQVQKAFQQAKASQFPTPAAFQQFLSESGQTMQDILFRVRVNQIYSKLLARHQATVSAATIQTYYNSHQSQFGTPASRDIRIVRTNTLAQANAAKSALQKGQSWTVVAKKYSIDNATKNKGGLLNGVTKGQEEKALDTAAFSRLAEQDLRPDPRPVRLLRCPGHQDQGGHPPDLGRGHAADQADPERQPADRRADRGRQPGQEGLAAEDEVPLRIFDG